MVQRLPECKSVGFTNGNCALQSPTNSLKIFVRSAVSMGFHHSRKRSAEIEHSFTQIPADAIGVCQINSFQSRQEIRSL
jgi:hypothetical protein